MVKGISRRVVVVKAPVGSIFDEAIFILRDDSHATSATDAENILREACSAAGEYVRVNCKRKQTPRTRPLLLFTLTVAAISLIALFICLK